MSRSEGRVFLHGGGAQLLAAVEEFAGQRVQQGYPERVRPGDLVILCADLAGEELPGGNAFSACRTLKEDPRVRVLIAIRATDPFGTEIARACLADGCLTIGADGVVRLDEQAQARFHPPFRRPPVDAVLQRLEQELASDAGRQRSVLQRMLAHGAHSWFLQHLADPETGLLGAEYAAFKLDEEFKRSQRMHQPLAVALLWVGREELLDPDPETRRLLLAGIAGVLLNECRDVDHVARFTPTCFLLLLPGTGSDGARTLLARLIDQLSVPREGGVRLDPRAGLATVPAVGINNRRQLLARAEACLCLAQEARDGERLGCVD